MFAWTSILLAFTSSRSKYLHGPAFSRYPFLYPLFIFHFILFVAFYHTILALTLSNYPHHPIIASSLSCPSYQLGVEIEANV